MDSDYLFGNAQYPSGSVPDGFDPGAYVAPTLFTGMHNDMQTAREEIFGPVGAVLSFPSIDEAVKIANDSIFGLAAGIWSSDVTIAHKMPCDIDAGVIWVNCFDHANSSTKSRRRSGNYDMLRLPVLMHCFTPTERDPNQLFRRRGRLRL